MSLYLIKTQLNFTSKFLDQITPNLNISARMIWSISEILKPFKKSQECIIKFKNSRLRLQFYNLIIYSCLFFKQYVKLLLTTILKNTSQKRLLNTPMYVNFNLPLFKIYHLTITCKIINGCWVIWQRFSPWFPAHEKPKPIVNLTYFSP